MVDHELVDAQGECVGAGVVEEDEGIEEKAAVLY
jgi:hypothetical protein